MGNKTTIIGSVPAVYVNGKKYGLVTEYKHFSKEEENSIKGGDLDRREESMDMIDITMPVFYEELNNIRWGTELCVVSKVFEGDMLHPEEMIPIGKLEEVYRVYESRIFVKHPKMSSFSTITYRFYVTEVESSIYTKAEK